MTTTQLQVDPKTIAFEKRQKDTGWGRAWAHLLPFYAIYYAITRRTITPAAWSFGGQLATSFALGFCVALANPDVTDKQLDNLGSLSVLSLPVWVKKGIDSSRKQGARKLQELDY